MTCRILFPNQLFQAALQPGVKLVIIEHPLFFTQLPFHKQKLILHDVSIRCFRDQALAAGYACEIITIDQCDGKALTEILGQFPDETHFECYEPRDDYLSREIKALAQNYRVSIVQTPAFLTTFTEWQQFLGTKKTARMQSFYIWQRKRLNILMDGQEPRGGAWSFDTENRKSLPKDIAIPAPFIVHYALEEQEYIKQATTRFVDNPGSADFAYPVTHEQARQALNYFLEHKLAQFGDYEDAVRVGEKVLFHSQLSPLLNNGLLTPSQVIQVTIDHAERNVVPINSLEGFIRQVIGWREYISLTYLSHGRQMRTMHALGHSNPLPVSFWSATTGIAPVDYTIQTVLETGYAHHIERLMILGVFMMLTETDPDHVYQWFYALSIDAYDWVMVPNVYAMSQYADGGMITTKPYICGSAYIRKMTDHPVGPWCEIWDALYWHWVSRHQDLLRKNPRTSMSVATWNKFADAKKETITQTATTYLAIYHGAVSH